MIVFREPAPVPVDSFISVEVEELSTEIFVTYK
jgi:hypothetical protein